MHIYFERNDSIYWTHFYVHSVYDIELAENCHLGASYFKLKVLTDKRNLDVDALWSPAGKGLASWSFNF